MGTKMAPTVTYKLHKNFLLHRKDEEIFILPLNDTEKVYKINGHASKVMILIEKQKLSLDEIFEQLKTSVPQKHHQRFREDIQGLMDHFIELNIIE